MHLVIGLDLKAGCKQNAFEIYLDVLEIYLDVLEIYFRCNLNVFNPIQAGGGCPPPQQFFLAVLKRFAVG